MSYMTALAFPVPARHAAKIAPARHAAKMRGRKEHAHLSDEALVALVARYDDAALAELYDRYGRVAFGLALRVLRDHALAEDAVQDGFLAIWRSAARFLPERARARTWILTLVHRRAVDLVRREQRRPDAAFDDDVEERVGSGGSDEATWLSFERERIAGALAQLPDPQREALELAYFEGFTQSELAERLGEPLGTIKSRIFNGLGRLRDLLQEAAPEEEEWNRTRSTT